MSPELRAQTRALIQSESWSEARAALERARPSGDPAAEDPEWLAMRAEVVPCTYFVTSQNVCLGRPFAHDESIGARNLRPNTVAEIRALAEAGVEIAGHTRTHADLGQTTDPSLLEEEIAGGALELEAITGRPVRYFAFPFGQHNNLSQVAFSIARRAGLECVASAYGGYNFPGDDPFHLQRFAVDDDLIRLKNWCGVDPRKQRLHPRFDYPTEQINQHDQTLAATAQ